MTRPHLRPMLAHAGGLDEFLLLVAMVGIPLLVLSLLAKRVRPDEEDDEEDDEDIPVD